MTPNPTLRSRAEALVERLPPLLAQARHLAASVELGEHGRRKPGQGDAFWQFRPAQPGDPAYRIDWRRSARSDHHYVQEKEWQAAQSVLFWVDPAASMDFASSPDLPEKGALARLIAMALAVLLVRGGERVGLATSAAPAGRGELALSRMEAALASGQDAGPSDLPARSRAVFLSDFLADTAAITRAVTRAADRGVTGVLFQLLDPIEEAFPFRGRMIFEDMTGHLEHDTTEAHDLRDRYLDRLAARKSELAELARHTGWQFHTHHSGDADSAALLWLYHAIEGHR
ncbi:hypothetical protein GCM10016455_19070 [Aliiroseovarius zhejiangensis]|uniref:DUF58 domain-containing protein n=1 Tax=Aliiroseovarius zhejiangensis TaxID=1632025 RepID=A0ABQ3J1P1_9RHOB|nr:DUF58 domain-containing protein [Aliiroseovarius zhejiangensis]GHE98540.1 hypothetical protein GCM10016455_19070 [Aliiroseovarius zhejiangensis]